MSREIKFRVWSEEDKEYRKDCRLLSLFDCVTGCPATIYNDEGDRFDIEQYTGLKDKNGKDIYEGDIVKIEAYGRVFQVVYRKWDCSFVYENDEDEEIYSMFDGFPDKYEIIGNIHENPELLGGVDD